MIIKLELFLRRIRRYLSRSRWAVSLFKLPRRKTQPHEPGLVILQIDGLSRTQLERALKNDRMPFLRELLDREEYRLLSNCSGVPSTTPAAQGELLYGEPQAVPAFNFIDRETGTERVLFEANSANAIAAELQERNGESLLRHGASYSNVFAGDADEARFCSQTLSLENWLKRANPFAVLFMLILHTVTLGRIASLIVIEAVLGIYDFIRGVFGKHRLLPELKFTLSRIGISILLRELIRFMVKADIVRGLPVIYANFLGYDEQAHRRGPSPAFAHWSLKGIDGTIKDIFRTATRAYSREYHIIVLSDHGQEATTSYRRKYDIPIQNRITELCAQIGITNTVESVSTPPPADRRHRARHYFRLAHKLKQRLPLGPTRNDLPVRVTAMGPLGHVYLQTPASFTNQLRLARLLVSEKAEVPWVFIQHPQTGGVLAISAHCETILAENPAIVLGTDHPFLTEASKDLEALCYHKNAGDLIIWGGGAPDEFITFAKAEAGSHGGPGAEEMSGFFMYPPEMQPKLINGYVRPIIIRDTILNWFAAAHRRSLIDQQHHGHTRRLRVVTYNIHSCIGMDGKIMPERIAAVLRRLRPDLVALQEVDSGRERSFYHDQLANIASEMNMQHVYFPLVKEKGGEYGIAMLSRYPFETIQLESFDSPEGRKYPEERGLVRVRVNTPAGSFHFMNTHFGLLSWEQMEQVTQLVGKECLGSLPATDKVVLCGDFNSLPGSKPYSILAEKLNDVQRLVPDHKPLPTFFGRRPTFRIDHIFVSAGIKVSRIKIPRSSMVRAASDHLPLCADIEIEWD